MLNLVNAGLDPKLIQAVVPVAFLFGGVVQLVAGIAEFRQGGTLGATGFSAFGGFWMSFAVLERFVVPFLTESDAHLATGLFLVPFAVMAAYMSIAALRSSGALLAIFLGATCTLTILAIGEFTQSPGVTRAGGGVGIATGVTALYGSFAGLINDTWGRHIIPTLPDPGRRLARLTHHKPRPRSLTASAGDRETEAEAGA